ncbi:MAG: hypothetical protein KJ887_05170 [Candidatus Omnitrophica bacterium]|nr:hypothetical protein [Candidatus Omnitrophota bacterium]MBU1047763.1 hypothetical protein [Candidatus Omnitrophota bacterium]MBU1631068.1 hypothetical protein [Candidatus Omnitrophota bacterium]MBU1767669.1 hypothetical protein [Candidatus Omnitrophota bacterium]MBU1889336.1 hypothetical protein [Candidatus Omnitrophota bacterium]
MNRLFLTGLFIFAFVLSFLDMSFAANEEQVIAYYFHTNFRCVSCHKIETYTEESIKKYFSKQIESNELIYKVVNVEEKGNEHFMRDYQLYTKSVVLSLVKDDKEIKFKNLDKVWKHLNNKDEFFEYIKEETQKFLNEMNSEEKQ